MKSQHEWSRLPLLSFAGDLADQAQTAFAKFLAQQHDDRAAQLS